MQTEQLKGVVVAALEDLKGADIRVIDVKGRCSFTDVMVFASGTSDRHVKSLANNVVEKVKEAGVRPLGVEGLDVPATEWVLVDIGDVVVHVMLPQARDFYQLEKLWATPASGEVAPSAGA
ncbi:MAG: ribosome silencing factor [Pseudomonadota bacterium]